ncbi:MAG: hypothetical protein P8Z71_11450 [Candidatus Sulfobium sp.]
MKALTVVVIAVSVILASSVAFAVGNDQVEITGTPYVTYDSATSAFFLIIPEIQAGEVKGWVKWRLDFGNISWEIVAADLQSNVRGTQTSSGHYVYDSQRGVLILDVENTDFLGCGLSKGIEVWFVSFTSSTMMTISNPLGEEVLTLTRQGAGIGIVGTWNAAVGPDTYSVILNNDGTFSGIANIAQCMSH